MGVTDVFEDAQWSISPVSPNMLLCLLKLLLLHDGHPAAAGVCHAWSPWCCACQLTGGLAEHCTVQLALCTVQM